MSLWTAGAGGQVPSFTSLSGVITDAATGTPLPGATVFIPDIKAGAVADGSGHYALQNLPRGTYLVQVRFTGYGGATEKISIQGATVHNWSLHAAVIEAGEVVITGVSRATEVRKSPNHISVIGNIQMQRHGADNIIGKIADLPGVSAVTTGPDVMKPVIRGLSSNRIVVLNDGVRQEGQQWGDEHGIEVDAYAAGRIEVMRGAASLMYGSDALGGVVNILPPDPAPEGKLQGHLIGNYQSNNGLQTYHADLKGNHHGLTWALGGTLKKAHDYRDPYDGYVFNSKYREGNWSGSVGLNRSWGYSHLSYSSYDLRLGIPEGKRDLATGAFLKEIALDDSTAEDMPATRDDNLSYDPYPGWQRVQHRKATLDNKIRLGGGSLGLTLAYQDNRRREYEDVLTPQSAGLDMRLHTLNYHLRYAFPELGGWQVTAGVNGMWQGNRNAGEEALIPAYRLFDVGVFAITTKTLGRLTLNGGLRYDARALHADGLQEQDKWQFEAFDRHFSGVSGQAGLSYSAGDHWQLKASVSRGFRMPSIPELASNGVHEGTARYEIGNTRLKPEGSSEFDAGAEFHSTHVSASLYGYYNDIRHFIFSRKLLAVAGGDSMRATAEGEYRAFRFDPTTARLYGIEASVDIHPHPLDWLHFENTFSLVRGRNAEGSDSTRYLPQIPAPRLLTELGCNFLPKGHLLRHLYLTLQWTHTMAQRQIFSAYGTETPTPAYALLGVEAGTDVVSRKGRTLFSLYLSAENITDEGYQDHLSRLKYLDLNPVTGRMGIFNMGRNFSVKVAVPLDLSLR